MLAAYRHVLTFLFLINLFYADVYCMPRTTQNIALPSSTIGTRQYLIVHNYAPDYKQATKKAYIQASLHADELPGMLVAHHLIKLLDAASKAGLILEEISVVPYANPIGLSQQLLGAHIGRFSVDTGRNFNRDFIDMGPLVSEKIGSILTDNPCENVRIIRKALLAEADNLISMKEESEMKRILYRMACISDIVIDLHCDSDAIMHMYMNDRLWPRLADLASELRSECQLLAPAAGFDSFDEACSCPWSDLQDRFPSYPIPMGCESVTVELRGESDVYDHLAIQDATAIFRFLVKRGYIKSEEVDLGSGVESTSPSLSSTPPLLRESSPLSGVDMVEADSVGIVAWRVRPGDVVRSGDTLGEIIDIENPDSKRRPIISRTSGVVFSMARHKLVRPGQVIIKVSGMEELAWRVGNLLTN